MSARLDSGMRGTDQSPWRMFRALGGVSLLSGLLIVFAYQSTLPRILANRQQAIEEAVFRVLPGATMRATYVIDGDALRLLAAEEDSRPRIYAGYDSNGALVGVALPAAGQGYQDVIRVLYGYSPATHQAIGFTVIESKETPGLGDKIGFDKEFLSNFDGLTLQLNDSQTGLQNTIVAVKHGNKKHPWEIDGISGATVSSKAIGRIIDESAVQMIPIILKHVAQLEARQ